MAGTIKVKAGVSGDVTQVKSLMMHPMETGTRKDADTGETVAAHFITQLTTRISATASREARWAIR